MTAGKIEAEAKIAASLGMKTIIVDDGWQTDDTSRGYAYCGDWEVSRRRFPDMAAHVKRVQAAGLKYMMWYSVPFVGEKSKNFGRFKGKYLYHNGHLRASVLDPRFPDVRALTEERIHAALPNVSVISPHFSPAQGAAMMAKELKENSGGNGTDSRSEVFS